MDGWKDGWRTPCEMRGRGLPCSTRPAVVPAAAAAAAAAAETVEGAVVCLPTARHTQTHTYMPIMPKTTVSQLVLPKQYQNCVVLKSNQKKPISEGQI